MSFQQYPHLFANGKFKCLSRINDYPCRIEGYDSDREEFIIERVGVEIESCTLIARPISDMTDEEREEFRKIVERNKFMSDGSWQDDAFESRLYVLSIGVYPFDQSHFETGTVIKAEQS